MTILFTNNAATTLASGITNVATTLTVASGQGALFPSPSGAQYFYATLENSTATIREIVKVTSRTTDTFTITRAQDGTTAQAWSTGDKVQLRVTAADLNNFGQLDTANTWASGQTFVAPVLGTPASGTLTNCTGYTYANLTGTVPTWNQNTTGTAASLSATLSASLGGTGIAGTLTGISYMNGTSAHTVATTAQLLSGIGTLPIANGGTGLTTTPANGALDIGNGTGFTRTTLTAGTGITITNGAGSISIAASGGGGGIAGIGGQVFTSSGTFTIPTGVTLLKVTVVGGGGNGGSSGGSSSCQTFAGGGGGAGAIAIKYLTGLTAGNTLTVTRGAAGGTSSVASGTQTITTVTATGGSAGVAGNGGGGGGGAGGSATNGDINIPGQYGQDGLFNYSTGVCVSGLGGSTPFGFGGIQQTNYHGGANSVGAAGTGFGSGGSGGASSNSGSSFGGGAGAGGIVIFEW
jgi:hypothetical protein